MMDNPTSQAGRVVQFVERVCNSLSLLQNDLILAEKEEVKFHYATDFAEVYAMTYPLGHHVQPMLGETPYETFRRELVTLSFTFAKTKEKVISDVTSLVMLPPYIEEMKFTLALLRYRAVSVNYLLDLSRRAQSLAFSPQAFTDDVRAIVGRNEEEGIAPNDEERKIIVNYICKTYPDFLAAVVSSSYNGAALLNRFLSDGTLQPAKRYFKKEYGSSSQLWESLQNSLEDPGINRRMVKYLSRISEFSSRKDKELPNRMDAAACTILKEMNAALGKTGDALLFITHSSVMNQLVEPIVIKTRKGNTFTTKGVRDLDYFWLYYAYKAKNRELMINNVNNALEIMNQFRQTGKRLEEVKKQVEYYNNVCLAAATDEDIRSLIGVSSSSEIAMNFLDVVEQEDVREALFHKRDNVDNYLKEILKSIESVRGFRKH